MKPPEKSPYQIDSEPITGGPILDPQVDEAALKRAKAATGKTKRKSFAEKTIGRAGKKNKPAEFFPLAFDYLTGEAL